MAAVTEDMDAELVRRMTAAMREADETFERVGGSTRHHVRDCLLPILGKHGLRLVFECNDPKCDECGWFNGFHDNRCSKHNKS